PLSIVEIIKLGSVDVETAALIWLMLEQGASFTIAGTTYPKPGVGKTTVLNALFQFLPQGAALVYTSGCYEDFAFTSLPAIDPATTYVLCNEISDHQPFYMWGRVARRYLMLPTEGYHIATSVHADTINDVIYMYHHELRLSSEAVRRLGLIVNIGMVGDQLRRWLTVHFLQPKSDPENPYTIVPLPLSSWNGRDDTFEHFYQSNLDELAKWARFTPEEFATALQLRVDCLRELVSRPNTDMDQMYDAIDRLRKVAL
ncbi:MAG: hypothetical protein ACJ8AG_23450, partial [Ktedonobacteraceae bacterium]